MPVSNLCPQDQLAYVIRCWPVAGKLKLQLNIWEIYIFAFLQGEYETSGNKPPACCEETEQSNKFKFSDHRNLWKDL